MESSSSSSEVPDHLSLEYRMNALHRATLSLFTDLSAQAVLTRIVRAAMDLTGARYGALGVPDGRGGLETFISQGLTEQEVARIEHHPVGKGLLGEMLRQGKTIRLREIADHPSSVGFPAGHPAMHTFLGVPISAYGRPLGQIYLTEKQGAPDFSDSDQRLIEMLAMHAAAAIENAHLFQQVVRSEREVSQRNEELELINSLASAVGSSVDVDELMSAMLTRAMQLFEAQAGEIFLLDRSDGSYRQELHLGQASEAFASVQRFQAGEGVVGEVAAGATPIVIHNLAHEKRFIRRAVVEAGFGSVVYIPLRAAGEGIGVLGLAFLEDRTISQREVGLLEAVGAGVGVAIENVRLARQERRLAVLEERERIAMDLHDGTIQSIYAVGLTLDYTRLLLEQNPAQVQERIGMAIDELNGVIRDIRSYILDLQPARMHSNDLEQAMNRLAREFKANTLIDVELSVEQGVSAKLSREQSTTFFHIAQEALANIAKHAQASRVWLNVRSLDDDLILQVIDNGLGFDLHDVQTRLGHGLSNMEERTRLVGGEFEVVSEPGEGTTITVRIANHNDVQAEQRQDLHKRQKT